MTTPAPNLYAARFQDVELRVRNYLHAYPQRPPARIVTRLPETIDAATVPLILVRRDPGGREQSIRSIPRVRIETFTADRGGMWTLAGWVHDTVRRLSGGSADGLLIDMARCTVDPHDVPWSATVERAVAVYEFSHR